MRPFVRSTLLLAGAALATASAFLAVAPAAPAGAATATDACAAITRKQVSAAAAKKVGAPKASTVGGVDTCTWTTTAGVRITYAAHPQTDATRADLDRLAADEKNLVVAGVGDKTIVQCTKGGPTSMECTRFGKAYVLNGDEYRVVTVSGLPKGFSVENELTALLQLGRNSLGQA